MEWLSESVEALIEDLAGGTAGNPSAIVVGSGYGGAVAALRIAEAGKDVILLERGREFVPGEFPNDLSLLAGQVRIQRARSDKAIGNPDALFDVRISPDVAVLVGNALGGGSQINANVALQPDERVFQQARWPREIRENPAALKPHYKKAWDMLGVAPARPFSIVDKVALMQELAKALTVVNGGACQANPAPVAVHFEAKAAHAGHGARQNPCCGCGDCITGCNYAAKNTLTMNYLPEARRAGACLYTGATVLSLRRAANGRTGETIWTVLFRRTADEKEPNARVYEIQAEVVVLAAGTLGSTEILLRSQRRWDLTMSPMLGQRFSCNGDLIGVGFDQRQPGYAVGGVHDDGANQHQTGHGVGDLHDDSADEHSSGHAGGGAHGGGGNAPCPGPTISAMIDLRGANELRHGVMLQNAVIPGALGRVFEEVVTCAAVAPQMLEDKVRHDHGADKCDPQAVVREAINHTHVYLAIGHDAAAGELKLRDMPLDELDHAKLWVHWPGAGEQDIYAREERLLLRTVDPALNGIYINNPLWKPLPDDFARVLSGPRPRGPVLTVHPLGGCPMGEDAACGVTNHKGEVFLGASGTDVHRGLYVMDGSVIPCSLGVNPFLTIAALAERNVKLLIRECNWAGAPRKANLDPMPEIVPRMLHEAPVAIRFSERMDGKLEGGAPFLPRAGRHPTSLALDFTVKDVDAFLQDPAHEVEEVSGVIAFGEKQDGKVTMTRKFPVNGSIKLLAREPSEHCARVRRALWQWLRSRGWREILQGLCGGPSGLWQEAERYLILASHIGERRFMTYTLSFEADGKHYDFKGRKTIQYARYSNPWRSLADLKVSIAPQDGSAAALRGTLTLDFADIVGNHVPQIVAQRDAPSGIAALVRIGMWMARILFKTHFWSFEAPEYPPAGRPKRRYPGRLSDGIRELELTRYWATPDPTQPLERILLTRYRSATARPGTTPVMLLHGFAHSGLVFAIDTVKQNMVQHLCGRGFDVWVVELRTSIALPSSLRQWTFDQIALEDVPVAVQKIIEIAQPSNGKIKVVAHCMGAACFSIAALAGRLAHEDGTSMIEAAVLMQVAPIIKGSPSNRMRASLAGFMRDFLGLELVDTSVDDSRTWLDVIADRLAMTYPLPEEEAAAHRSFRPCRARTDLANCNRNSALFGRQWKHTNLNRETHEAVGELLGHANTTTFAQIAHFIECRRVVNREGENVYALNENICKYMSFPIAFVHGMENDVFHPDTSIETHGTFAALNPTTYYELHVVPEYGHLDCLLGKNAHADVFVKVSDFLRKTDYPARAAARVRVPGARPRLPELGPILGWIRPHMNTGKPLVRIWVKANAQDVSPALMLVTLVFEGIQPDLAARKALPDQCRIWPILQLCGEPVAVVDVPLPDGDRDYSILLLTVHLSEQPADPADAPHGVARVSPAALTGWLRGLHEALPEGIVRNHQRAEVLLPHKLLQHTLEKRSKISFLAGSCHFPGTAFERDRSDAIFGEMLRLLEGDSDSAPALLLMLGDQIYADATAELFDIKSPRERIVTRYDEAYGLPNQRELMRRLPTFMTADDHEIADNWEPGYRRRPGGEDTYKWGRSAYRCHQWAASPRTAEAGPLADDGNLHADRFWYKFESGGFGFFVMDTRFEREERNGPRAEGYAIASRRQIDALKTWLSERRDKRPKFIACGSVVVPFVKEVVEQRAYALRDDSWYGYQKSLIEVLGYIAQEKIPNVVFLCGDYHVSFASEMTYSGTFTDDGPLRSYCIVASPFYGPLPFANGRIDEHVLDTANCPAARIELPDGAWLDYKVIDAFEGDTFARVDAREEDGAWQLQVQFHRGPEVPIPL